MKTKIRLSKREIWLVLITLMAGLLFGWLIFEGEDPIASENEEGQIIPDQEEEEAIIWTCSMHPQIRMDEPGKCPICAMDLIPLEEMDIESGVLSAEIRLSEAAARLADIQTMEVKRAQPEKTLHLLGKIEADERNIAEMTARFGGRIEKLYVNFTGQIVQQGEKLASIYSPELVTAQRELLEAVEYRESNPGLYQAVRNKLRLWDIAEKQIDLIEKEGEAQTQFDILSPISGTVTKRHVSVGDYIKDGTALFQLTDLSKVWVLFEAYESDLPWLEKGDRVSFTIRSIPGKRFEEKITFIDPTINPQTRTANMRVEVDNPNGVLKPGMFADGVIHSEITGNKTNLVIPKTAVLWTGKRSVVYVKVPEREQPTFEYREITLGPEAADYYLVEEGLNEGEEIALNGVFKIDASAQLAGKPSMMNPSGGESSAGHRHDDPDMKKGPEMEKGPDSVDPEFIDQLSSVYNAYIPMKNAFVESNPQKVKNNAQKVSDELESVNMELLSEKPHMEWMEFLNDMKEEIDKIISTADIKIQREAFADFNQSFYKSLKRFGLKDATVYYQYCPMAIDDEGAYWLSEHKEIRNPYFGEKMMTCGETREILQN